MIRQRVRLRSFGFTELVLRLLATLLGLAMVFYGAMVILAAFKLSPDTINSISRYRTIDHALSTITAGDITGLDRVIVAGAGVVCLLVFGALLWRALPRPYLARTDTDLLADDGPGRTEIGPRALERAAELSLRSDQRVSESRARYAVGALEVQVQLAAGADRAGVSGADGVAAVGRGVHRPGEDGDGLLVTLRAVQQRVRRALADQGLPAVTVDVTLAGVSPSCPTKEVT